MDAGVEALRRDPSAIIGLGVTEIADHYDHIIRGLDPPPVIIGHCLGGLAAQILLDRGLGAAGAAIDAAPAKGILKRPFSMLKACFPVLSSPANRHKTVALTPRQFRYAFTNTLDEQNAAAVYGRYHVPGPGRAICQVSFANFAPHTATRVQFRRDQRAPLLLIADGRDHLSRPVSPDPASRGTASRRPSLATRSSPADPTTRSANSAGNTSPTTRSGG
jgi:pimeloyl-ACP methyl ester carboxylesterase